MKKFLIFSLLILYVFSLFAVITPSFAQSEVTSNYNDYVYFIPSENNTTITKSTWEGIETTVKVVYIYSTLNFSTSYFVVYVKNVPSAEGYRCTIFDADEESVGGEFLKYTRVKSTDTDIWVVSQGDFTIIPNKEYIIYVSPTNDAGYFVRYNSIFKRFKDYRDGTLGNTALEEINAVTYDPNFGLDITSANTNAKLKFYHITSSNNADVAFQYDYFKSATSQLQIGTDSGQYYQIYTKFRFPFLGGLTYVQGYFETQIKFYITDSLVSIIEVYNYQASSWDSFDNNGVKWGYTGTGLVKVILSYDTSINNFNLKIYWGNTLVTLGFEKYAKFWGNDLTDTYLTEVTFIDSINSCNMYVESIGISSITTLGVTAYVNEINLPDFHSVGTYFQMEWNRVPFQNVVKVDIRDLNSNQLIPFYEAYFALYDVNFNLIKTFVVHKYSPVRYLFINLDDFQLTENQYILELSTSAQFKDVAAFFWIGQSNLTDNSGTTYIVKVYAANITQFINKQYITEYVNYTGFTYYTTSKSVMYINQPEDVAFYPHGSPYNNFYLLQVDYNSHSYKILYAYIYDPNSNNSQPIPKGEFIVNLKFTKTGNYTIVAFSAEKNLDEMSNEEKERIFYLPSQTITVKYPPSGNIGNNIPSTTILYIIFASILIAILIVLAYYNALTPISTLVTFSGVFLIFTVLGGVPQWFIIFPVLGVVLYIFGRSLFSGGGEV